MVEIYTDGSCLANGSKNAEGGYGVVVVEDGRIIEEYAKRSFGTTNNREELKAIIWAINEYGHLNPNVYSDSSYSINTLTNWMWTWKSNGWVKSDKKTPENLDLIQLYDLIKSTGKKINLIKVKGHNGNYYNERADGLATGKIMPKGE